MLQSGRRIFGPGGRGAEGSGYGGLLSGRLPVRPVRFGSRRISGRRGSLIRPVRVLLDEKTVSGPDRVLADLIQPGKIDRDPGPCGFLLCLPVGVYDRFRVRRGPFFLRIFPEIGSGFQISAQLPVRFVQKTLKPFPVKVEPVIPLFLPYPAAAVIGPARIQRIIGVRMRLLLPIDSVGERTPGKGLPLAEAGREKIPSLSGPGPARKAPDFCEQPRSSFPEPFHHRGLLCLFPGQEAERGKQRLILRGFRIPQDRKGGVSFQQDGIGAALRQRQGNVLDYGIVQHPATQVPAHAVSFRFQAFSAGGLHASVQETGLKGLHFFNGILRRTGSDPVQQLIQVQIGHGCGNGGKLSFSDAGAPGKISSKLPEVQIMIGGEIVPVNPVPGSVVFIVLHESALTVKIPALFREGAVSVFVQPLHAAELFRDFRQRGIRVCRICFGGRPHVGRDA